MVDAFKSTKIPRLRGGGEDVDRLSNLPEPIIHHIFSFLGTIDVVRASAVSRKWRCFWLSIPYLNFNIHNIWSNPQEKCCRPLLNVVFAKPDCFFSPLYNLKSLKLIVGPFDQTIQSTINLLNCSPNLEALAIYFDWLLNVVFAKPDCFFSPLYNLKSLKLIVGPFDQTIQSTINLLNCSPNLEALAIYFDWFKDGDLWKIPDKGIPCLTHHLKTVEILEFYGNENQLELVRFILKYGQVLQKMSITWGYSGVKYPIKISRQ
ncbi:hypothetical protein CUMW_263230, partial [Citrus unshiu]